MIRYSKLVSEFRSSAIRDLMGLALRPDIISFAGGMPDNDLFPIHEIDKIYNGLSTQLKKVAFQYGPTTGLPSLIDSLSEFLAKKQLKLNNHKLLITTGSLQAINILAKLMIDPGDEVIVENPCFIGALSAFKSYGANLIGIPLDNDGMQMDIFEEKLAKSNPKFVYITPNFHNPAGITYSIEKKLRLIELLRNRNIPIIEDDAYADLWFYEEDLEIIKPIQSMNADGIDVCYTGSFSKILGPGFRLGWMLVPEHMFRNCELVKQCFDACSPSFTQVLADEFLRKNYIDSYTSHIRNIYKQRAVCMVNQLNEYMPDYVTWNNPRGGFYIWLKLPEGIDSTEILKLAIGKGAVFVVGKTFDPDEKKNNFIRLSYCNTSEDKIISGIQILSEAIKEICG